MFTYFKNLKCIMENGVSKNKIFFFICHGPLSDTTDMLTELLLNPS